jgi:phosphodiesterase/alkaline phosphatase D-like protein
MAGAELRLGPLLRYVDEHTATIWVETDRPCEARVVCDDGTGAATAASRSWQVAGHHYALVTVTGLRPGTSTAYRVTLDGQDVWPLPGSPFPPSLIRTPSAEDRPLRVVFGSCHWAAPGPDGDDPAGPDALCALGRRIAADPDGAARPDVLLLLGDQIYADETSAATRAWLAGRRDTSKPPGDQVADYEEYTHLYDESWLDPEVRWLLSTVPSLMIFDDHDVIDDWNTSQAWREDIRATPWWQERIVSGLTSYWVYQHLGNLSPAELAPDARYAAVRATEDGTDALRAFATRADADPAQAHWSYRRDFGRVRLLMVDSRAARVLDEDHRAMLDRAEFDWLRDNAHADGSFDHLLIGTSLPWLLPHSVHNAEAWSAALAQGARGPRWAARGERLRRAADLEHWAAFPGSFAALADIVAAAGTAPGAPATVLVLSGDVHHAYAVEAGFPGRPLRSRVLQLTCSPVHNAFPAHLRAAFRFAWSPPARLLGRLLARHGRTPRPPVTWRKRGGPWFGNQLMTLVLHNRTARARLDQARPAPGGAHLVTVLDTDLLADG